MRFQSSDDGTVDESEEKLNQVRSSIQKTLGLLLQLHLTVSSFNPPESQLHLLQRLNSLVMELDSMSKLSEKCSIQVTMEAKRLAQSQSVLPNGDAKVKSEL